MKLATIAAAAFALAGASSFQAAPAQAHASNCTFLHGYFCETAHEIRHHGRPAVVWETPRIPWPSCGTSPYYGQGDPYALSYGGYGSGGYANGYGSGYGSGGYDPYGSGSYGGSAGYGGTVTGGYGGYGDAWGSGGSWGTGCGGYGSYWGQSGSCSVGSSYGCGRW